MGCMSTKDKGNQMRQVGEENVNKAEENVQQCKIKLLSFYFKITNFF